MQTHEQALVEAVVDVKVREYAGRRSAIPLEEVFAWIRQAMFAFGIASLPVDVEWLKDHLTWHPGLERIGDERWMVTGGSGEPDGKARAPASPRIGENREL